MSAPNVRWVNEKDNIGIGTVTVSPNDTDVLIDLSGDLLCPIHVIIDHVHTGVMLTIDEAKTLSDLLLEAIAKWEEVL